MKKIDFRKAMSAMAVVASAVSASAAFTDTTGMELRLVPSSIGTCPEVKDITGNGHDAMSYNGVSCGKMSNGRHLTGFTTTTSYLAVTNAVSSWNVDWTAVTWVRNPNLSDGSPMLVMRGCGSATNIDGGGGNVAWQVWLELDGRIGIGIQNWGGQATNNLAESVRGPVLEWKADTWYQIAAVCKYTVSGANRIRNIKVYVTAAGSASVGECVAELEQNTAAGFVTSLNFVVGAGRRGYYVPMVAGCFGGDIAETTLFTRRLALEELAADVRTFAPTWFPTEDFASLYWKLDETGDTPTAIDATTNGIDGVTIGAVSGGAPCPQGGSYTGFGSTSDRLYGILPSTAWFQSTTRSEVLLWVRKPCPTADSTALLASSMKIHSSPGAAQPWRVSVQEDGAFVVSMQSWNGRQSKSVGEPYDWGRDWHLVSIRVDKTVLPVVQSTTENGDGTVTTNMVDWSCHRIRVYAARAAAAGTGDFRLVATGVLQHYNADLESGDNLVFGSAGSGYYASFRPSSILGSDGRLGEIALSHGGYFEWEYLRTRLSRYYVPPKGFLFSVR